MAHVKDRTSVEERLQALEDERGILRTLYQYARALDYANGRTPDQFVDCFLEDGLWHSTIEGKWAGAAGLRLQGRARLAQWYSGLRYEGQTVPVPRVSGTPGHYSKHMIVEPDIRIDGDTATAESYMMTLQEHPDGPRIHTMGRYLDRLVRCPDGRWRFKERNLSREGVHKDSQDKIAG